MTDFSKDSSQLFGLVRLCITIVMYVYSFILIFDLALARLCVHIELYYAK